MASPEEIKAERQLVVEGADDRAFFQALIKHLGRDDVQVQKTDGKGALKAFLKALVRVRGFRAVQSLGIVRDADTNSAAALQSVRAILGGVPLPVPAAVELSTINPPRPAVSILILPDAGSTGALETLCLRAVAGDPAFQCVDDFFVCLRARHITIRPVQLDKARAHAFLASRPSPDLRVGEAASSNYWDLDAPAFQHVRSFIQAL